MSQKWTALICFGCSLVWMALAVADISRMQNAVIAGILLVAGIASMLRIPKNGMEDVGCKTT